MKFILLAIYLFYSSISVAEIDNKTEILWLTDDKNDEKNYLEDNQLSIGTDTNNLLLKKIKNYQLNFQLASIPRMNLLLKSTGNICVANRVKTKERALDNIFSLPVNIYPGLKLYYIENISGIPKNIVNLNGELTSLLELFQIRPDKVIGMSKGRSFGMYLDKEVNKIPKENVFIRAGTGRYEALIQMLIKRRIDYVIDFPTEVNEKISRVIVNNEKAESTNLTSVAIANSPAFIFGRVACTKTAVGEAFIGEVNKMLLALYKSPVFYQTHARYINQNDLSDFKILFDQEFGKLLAKH